MDTRGPAGSSPDPPSVSMYDVDELTKLATSESMALAAMAEILGELSTQTVLVGTLKGQLEMIEQEKQDMIKNMQEKTSADNRKHNDVQDKLEKLEIEHTVALDTSKELQDKLEKMQDKLEKMQLEHSKVLEQFERQTKDAETRYTEVKKELEKLEKTNKNLQDENMQLNTNLERMCQYMSPEDVHGRTEIFVQIEKDCERAMQDLRLAGSPVDKIQSAITAPPGLQVVFSNRAANGAATDGAATNEEEEILSEDEDDEDDEDNVLAGPPLSEDEEDEDDVLAGASMDFGTMYAHFDEQLTDRQKHNAPEWSKKKWMTIKQPALKQIFLNLNGNNDLTPVNYINLFHWGEKLEGEESDKNCIDLSNSGEQMWWRNKHAELISLLGLDPDTSLRGCVQSAFEAYFEKNEF